MATAWSHLEQNPAQGQMDPPQSGNLDWDDFSKFYKTANEWDYPVHDRASLLAAQNAHSNGLINHDDMFKNHGSRDSMDNLADEMGKKWNYSLEHDLEDESGDANRLLPKDNTSWNATLSNTAQASVTIPDDQFAALQHHKASITDAQGIDMSEDHALDDKDAEIKELQAKLQQIEAENKALLDDNQRLKLRNGELRKTLNKAQQYRRKSSIAVHNLMNIGDNIKNLKQQNDTIMQDGRNEEKVREEEALNNQKIQEQIQAAISMFQEEFGAELDEELNNIESFQYESLPEESQSVASDTAQNDDAAPKTTQQSFQEMNESEPFSFKGALDVDFRIKFTDAHSNPGDAKTMVKAKDKQKEYRFVDEMDPDDDALPDAFNTPGGPEPPQSNDHVTPGGPEENEQLIEMEQRLNSLGERVLSLMERIEELTDRNQQLELSKMELITNTSDAMNEYRDTIKRISQQNQMLVTRIKAK
eukprot:125441_1